MRDDVLLAPAPAQSERPLERCRGAAELRFAQGEAGRNSHVAHLYQQTPCRALFPRPEAGDPVTAVLLTTSGGLTGGDSLRLAIEAEAGASAVVTTQAAEKIYRSLGEDCSIDVSLAVGAGAWLEWLPQETILFDRARLVRRNAVEVAAGGRLLAVELVVFGRTAHGERFEHGKLHDAWRVKRRGRLAWADALHLEGGIAETLDHPAGFDGAVAMATVLYVAEDAPERLGTARELIEGMAFRAGATVVNGLLHVRLLGRDALALRRDVIGFCADFRAAVAGLPARLPRVWST
jgi:urease accessory protein